MGTSPFRKILIANRGEIALRVLRACRELRIGTVAVYSEVDREALHVRWADEAYLLGPAPAAESYLRSDKILQIAKKAGVDAVHPGYGFLAENASFADECTEAGLKFIGPSGDSMRSLGDKLQARRTAGRVKVPVIPGIQEPLPSALEALRAAEKLGYPVLLKARAGGGGKGMRKVAEGREMEAAFRLASSEAASSFKDPALYLEKYIEGPHHVEVQILGDRYGNVVALGERECSVQRRHQKVIEESPSPFISEATRKKLLEAAVLLGREARYENAGTIEFLVDRNQDFYFLEVNARLQVEHPVTEQVTGVDLVRAQLRVAAGERLDQILTGPVASENFLSPSSGGQKVSLAPPVRSTTHAIECRLYAEDPDNDFLPSPGKVSQARLPEGPWIRVDSAVFSGSEISVYYDPMIAKVITWGNAREEAILRMERALRECRIIGVRTNVAFLEAVLSHPDFRKGDYDTGFVERNMADLKRKSHEGFEEIAALTAVIHQGQKTKAPPVVESAGPGVSPWKGTGRREGVQ